MNSCNIFALRKNTFSGSSFLKTACFYAFLILVVEVLISKSFSFGDSGRFLCVVGTIEILSILLFICKSERKFFSPIVLVFLSFSLFHFGQNALYAFGVKYNDSTSIFSLSNSSLQGATIYTLRCIYSFGIGVSIVLKKRSTNVTFIESNIHISKKSLSFLMIVFYTMSLIVLLANGFFFLSSIARGYTYMMSIKSKLVSISLYSIIEYMYVPLGIMYMVFSNDKNHCIPPFIFLCFYGFMSALSGERTVGLCIFATLFVFNRRLLHKQQEKKLSLKRFTIIALLIVFGLFLISFIENFRNISSRQYMFSNGIIKTLIEKNFVVSAIGEMGGSFMPTAWIRNLVNDGRTELYNGRTYFGALFTFIPSSIDFTGIVSEQTKISTSVARTIINEYNFTWGTGSSFAAESYLNFGEFGFLVLILVGAVVCFLLTPISKKNSLFGDYVRISMLYELFTSPRRDFYYIINSIFYIIVFGFIIYYFLGKKKVIPYDNRR